MAKKREVAELSGNFRRACPHSDEGGGDSPVFCRVGKNKETHGGVCKVRRFQSKATRKSQSMYTLKTRHLEPLVQA